MKFFAITTLAAAALTLAACGETKNEETAPSNAATETVTLNDDGSVATDDATDAASASAVAPVGQQHQL